MDLVAEMFAITSALAQAGIEYAICGGLAVTIHGATRTTKDIDLLMRPLDIARALEVVRPLGYSYVALPMTFDAATPRERQVQRVSKLEAGAHMMLDLIAEGPSLRGLLEQRVEVELPEGRLAVVSRDALIAMKRLAGRAQDLADIEALERVDVG